jgi:hypothetical protein
MPFLSLLLSKHLIMLIVSIGRDYVSELQPPTGMLFIPQVNKSMESHGGMVSAGECPHKGNYEFGLRNIFV